MAKDNKQETEDLGSARKTFNISVSGGNIYVYIYIFRIKFIFNYVGILAFLHQTTLQRMLCSIAELDGITSCCFLN